MEDITDNYDFSLLDPSPVEPKYLFEPIFTRICKQFTCDTGKNTLIPSPSLYEAAQLLPLNVVTMKKKQTIFGSTVKEYSTYDISLANLLIGQPVLELQIDSKYSLCNSYTTCNAYSFQWKNRGYIFDIIVGSLSFFFDIKISCKFGKLIQRKIGYESFMSALKERKLDMNHHFIREIKDAKHVLCVIRNVMRTSDQAEIQCTNKKGGNINHSKKVNRFVRMHNVIEVIASTVKGMVIEPGTALAYDVWELRVDVKSGKITPIMMAQNSGGFFEGDFLKIEKNSLEKLEYIKDFRKIETYSLEKYHYIKDKDNVASTLQHLQDTLQPLRHGTEAGDQPIKCSLFDLMTCYSDVVAMSKILSKAKHKCLNENKRTIDKKLIKKDTVWSILKFVGVQIVKGRVLYEKEATPILIALEYMIDAILELDNDDVDIISRCDETQLKTLSKIFESAVTSRMPIPIGVDMSSVSKEPVSSFLKQKKFTVGNDSIQPPKTTTFNVECIFRVLYCLS